MIYFLTPQEGGKFIKIIRKSKLSISELINNFADQKLKCVCIFEDGTVYDGFLPEFGLSFLREDKDGKEYYNRLLSFDLPEEEIA